MMENYDNFDGGDGSQMFNTEEFAGEDYYELPNPVGKPTKIKAGALFPEDCPMNDKILKTESALYAKSILKTISTENGTSLYDHLCGIVREMIDERFPTDAADYLEELSAQAKLKRYGMIYKDVDLTNKELTETFLSYASMTLKIWETNALPWVAKSEDENAVNDFQNTLRVQGYLQQIDSGLPKEEMYRIALSLNKLYTSRTLENPRFWGKIIGTRRVYYVVEISVSEETDVDTDAWVPPRSEDVEDNQPDFQAIVNEAIQQGAFPILKGDETLERAGKAVTNDEILEAYRSKSKTPVSPTTTVEEIETEMEMPGEDYMEFYGEGDGAMIRKKGGGMSAEQAAETAQWEMYQKELLEDFPVAIQIPDPEEVPWEVKGHGVNRRGFYVCNDLEGSWILLPSVTPQQINRSRSIRWALTGNLNAKIQAYPVFPGREGHYLRALLARITAGTHISPRGFYKSSKSLEEEDDDEDLSEAEEPLPQEDVTRQVYGDDAVVPSSSFRLITIKNLLFDDARGWVHHTSYILPQGRTVQFSGKKQPDESDEEEEEEGEDTIEEGVTKEVALPLFSSLNQDRFAGRLIPWSVRSSSEMFSEYQIAGIRSNVWPGAVAYCTQKSRTDNIYIGNGLKFQDGDWAPSFTDIPQAEYPDGPELREMPDPPIEIEQEYINAIIEAQFALEAKSKSDKGGSQDGFYYDEEEVDEYDTEGEDEMEGNEE